MDKHLRRRIKRVYRKLIELRPHLNDRNPTPEAERAEAQWILGEECKDLMKHLPWIYAKIEKEAKWFLRNGKLYPLTSSVKHVILSQ